MSSTSLGLKTNEGERSRCDPRGYITYTRTSPRFQLQYKMPDPWLICLATFLFLASSDWTMDHHERPILQQRQGGNHPISPHYQNYHTDLIEIINNHNDPLNLMEGLGLEGRDGLRPPYVPRMIAGLYIFGCRRLSDEKETRHFTLLHYALRPLPI